MRHMFYHTLLSFLMTLIMFMAVSGNALKNRASPASTTTNHKRPPFNGSIFGKRSGDTGSSTANLLLKANSQQMEILPNFDKDSTTFGQEIKIDASPIEILTRFLQQQEPLIRAAFNQCTNQLLYQYQVLFSGQSSPINQLCSRIFFANNREDSVKKLDIFQLPQASM